MRRCKLTWQYDARVKVTESLVCDFPDSTTEADINAMSQSELYEHAAHGHDFVYEDYMIYSPLDTHEDLSGAAAKIEPWEDTQDES